MKSTHYLTGLVGAMVMTSLVSGCSSTATNTDTSKVKTAAKTETISAKGKYGTLQEKRVKAMHSENRYIPTGSQEGYRIIDPSLADPKENAYRDPEKLLIPSFTVKNW